MLLMLYAVLCVVDLRCRKLFHRRQILRSLADIFHL